MVAVVKTIALVGIEGALVEVETDLKQGLPGIQIVGMGNKAIDEARERVRSAIANSSLDFPARKLTINLAPAELPKDGAHFDLPIALSILVAAGQLQQTEVDQAIFAGELSLTGELRPVRGSVTIIEAARRDGFKRVFIPAGNVAEAALIKGIEIYTATTLQELFLHLKSVRPLPLITAVKYLPPTASRPLLLGKIKGQDQAKRALLIAAAGRHNLLLCGPPGAGKTMLARALIELLPPLSEREALEVAKLHSLITTGNQQVLVRPFRSPHHTASSTALIGGGARPRPGEISLAHRGVLFLDELPEFSRTVLETLRQPLEDKQIHIVRAHQRITYPADFMLIATMNPCPCGFLGDQTTACSCTANQIQAYNKRLSGPLLDRIDMVIEVPRLSAEQIFYDKSLNKTQHDKLLKILSTARQRQLQRSIRDNINNVRSSTSRIQNDLALAPAARQLLIKVVDSLGLTARGSFKVLKVARTIADLDDSGTIETRHVTEALQFRHRTGT